MSKFYSVRTEGGILIAKIPRNTVFEIVDRFDTEIVPYKIKNEPEKKCIRIKEDCVYNIGSMIQIYFWSGFKLIPN